jgi:hypothetical protein
MSNDNNNLNNKETIKDAFIIYVVVLILIFLFPPMNIEESKNYVRFIGWNFISGLGGETKIDIPYLLVEVGMATLVYIFFLISQKNS